MKQPLVYLCTSYSDGGKITDPVHLKENLDLSLKWADEIWRLGACPYVPLLTHYWHEFSPKRHWQWLAHDCQIIRRCDALLAVMPSTCELSHGQRVEWEVATALDIHTFLWNKPMYPSTDIQDAHDSYLASRFADWINKFCAKEASYAI